MIGAKFIALTWDEIDEMLNKIAERVKESGFKPDVILGVSKGGIIPAAILSDRLGVDSDIIGVRYYKSIGRVMRRPEILRHVSIGLRGKRVLVIDDVADTGHSLQLVVRYVRKRGAEKVMTCTLHYKPWAIIKPDYFLTETKAWIIYPWEINETVESIAKSLERRRLGEREIKKELRRMGVPEGIVREILHLIGKIPRS